MPRPGVLGRRFKQFPRFRVFGAVAATVLATSIVSAQWRTPNKPGTARTQFDPAAPAPRTVDDHPDLTGLWAPGPPPGTVLPFGERVAPQSLPRGVSAATPMHTTLDVAKTEAALAIMQARQARDGRDNPRSHCLPMGLLQLYTQAVPMKVLQTPAELVLLFEGNGERREIFTDGRSLPGTDAQPFWNGYSVGRWEGDTLVAETSRFRDGGWLDMTGAPLSGAAKITERFRRPALGRLEIDVTIDDLQMFVRPFTVRVGYGLRPDDELIEHVCLENNKFGLEPGLDRP